MKRTILVGLLSGAVAIAGAPVVAELVAASQQAEPATATQEPSPTPQEPAAGETEPQMQPETEAADVSGLPSGAVELGDVRIPRAVQANGEPLAAGTYQVRLTAETADATQGLGSTPEYERWVEFMKGDKVVGREMASIVPDSEIDKVAQSGKPATGGSRVEPLKGDDFIRVWINKEGNNVLVHLTTDAPGT